MSKRVLGIIAGLLVTAGLAHIGSADDKGISDRIELIKKAGYTYENWFMKARQITISGVQAEIPGTYPERDFPYKWDFSDNTTSGAYPTGDTENFRVEDGKLKFTTAGDGSYINWGSILPSQKPLNWSSSLQLSGFRMRIKQSLAESNWQFVLPPMGRRQRIESRVTTIKGADWQEVVIRHAAYIGSPWPAVQIGTDTPGNEVEIDWIVPICDGQTVAMRKVLYLPTEAEWAKCSISTKVAGSKIYINGKAAVTTYPGTSSQQLWNYDIDPALFKKGKNVVLIETLQTAGTATILFDAALLCKDGTYIRFDSDETWKRPIKIAKDDPANWHSADFDDSTWIPTQIYSKVLRTEPKQEWVDVDDETFFYGAISDGRRFFFNPSWKGQIIASPSDGRAQPVFGSSEDMVLKISVPFRQGVKQEVTYRIYDEMGDDLVPEDKLVKNGVVALQKDGIYNTGEITVKKGELPFNIAYAVVLTFNEDGKEVEKYNYETALCGPLNLPEIKNPKDYTDGMKLKLVWELDAADEQKDGTFISVLGNAREAPSSVVETPIGRFRTTNRDKMGDTAGGCSANFISFKYTLNNPGRPHIAIAEYPDDAVRFQEMRLNDGFSTGNALTIGSDSVVMGIPTPPSHTIKHHHTLFFPNEKNGTITFFGIGDKNYYKPSQAAHVGKMRIYEILDDVAVRKINDAPGKQRLFGQHPEAGPRQIVTSCFTGPAAAYFKGFCMLANNSPYFYRNWMVTYRNMVRRLKFAGENSYFSGQVMYGNMLFPSRYSNASAFDYGRSPGEMRDYGVLMSRMFEENDMGWFSSLQLTDLPTIKRRHTDEAVAEGQDTLGVVTKDGKQIQGVSGMTPNWLRPENQEVYKTIINELLELYGAEKGWKGIKLYINEANGPIWASWEGPLMTSYDDFTIALFEKETGIKLPNGLSSLSDKSDTPDPQRFQKRYEWLVANAKEKWIKWRADKITELYAWTRDRLVETRPDLELLLFCQLEHSIQPNLTEPVTTTTHERALAHGFDLDGLKKEKNMIVTVCAPGTPRMAEPYLEGKDRFPHAMAVTRNDDYMSSLADDGKSGISFRTGWYEPQPNTPENWVWPKGNHQLMGLAWPFSHDRSLAENWVNIFIRSNPTLIINSLQDLHMWKGREYYTSRFAQAFRSIPNTEYKQIKDNGLDKNMWVSAGKYENDVYGYVANPFWWNSSVTLTLYDNVKIEDLITDETVSTDSWTFNIEPYEIRTFKIKGGAQDKIFTSGSADVEQRARDYITETITEDREIFSSQSEIIERTPGLMESLEAWMDECETLFNEERYGDAYHSLVMSKYSPKAKQLAWTLPDYEPLVAKFPRASKKIVVDGDLNDWKGLNPVFEINDPEKLLLNRGTEWQGPEDLSAKAYAQWDNEHLYLAFDVTDDDLQPGTFGGDSVELYFDMSLYGDYGDGVYSDDDFNFKIAPVLTSSETSTHIAQGKDGVKQEIPAKGGINSAWKQTPAGYMIEVSIPWKTLLGEDWRFGKPEPGFEFGFDTMVIDRDANKDPKPLRVMFWSSTKIPFTDPRTFGRAVLVDK